MFGRWLSLISTLAVVQLRRDTGRGGRIHCRGVGRGAGWLARPWVVVGAGGRHTVASVFLFDVAHPAHPFSVSGPAPAAHHTHQVLLPTLHHPLDVWRLLRGAPLCHPSTAGRPICPARVRTIHNSSPVDIPGGETEYHNRCFPALRTEGSTSTLSHSQPAANSTIRALSSNYTSCGSTARLASCKEVFSSPFFFVFVSGKAGTELGARGMTSLSTPSRASAQEGDTETLL